jgi:hypothetical protein
MSFRIDQVHDSINKVKKAAEDLNKSAETEVKKSYIPEKNQENNPNMK